MAEDTLIMWSVSQIAERDNVSKQAVSKAVKKLLAEKPDTPVDRNGQGHVSRVSLAHYDHYRQKFVNPAKAAAPIRTIQPTVLTELTAPSDSFDEARRQSEWLKVGRERIRHQEAIDQLVRKDVLEEAIRNVGLEIQAVIKRLPNQADDVALAVSKEGIHGARIALRQIAFEIGNQIADKLTQIASDAPLHDALIEDATE